MTLNTDSRRRTPEGELALVRVRDAQLLRTLRESVRVPVGQSGKTRPRSQREFAQAAGISHGHYAEIESGKKNPSFEVAERITALHNTTVDALFERENLEFGPPAVAS